MPGQKLGSGLALGFKAREVNPRLSEAAGDFSFCISERLNALARLNAARFRDRRSAGQGFDCIPAASELFFGKRLCFRSCLPAQVCKEGF